MATENPFVKLFAIDFKDHLEVKKSGNTELKYVSWAYAWAEVKKLYPAASYEVKKFNGLPRHTPSLHISVPCCRTF